MIQEQYEQKQFIDAHPVEPPVIIIEREPPSGGNTLELWALIIIPLFMGLAKLIWDRKKNGKS